MKLNTIISVAVCAISVFAQETVETVPELELSMDTTVNVPEGAVRRIEYISGKENAKLLKEGLGTLEVAIVGNTNASFFVNGGKLKFVRPGKLRLAADEAAFHVDGSNPFAYDMETLNGTNFVTKMRDAEGRSTYATKYSNSRPNPYIVENGLNGLPVFDFGSMHGSGATGYGAAMRWSEVHLPFEVFYVWCDNPDAKMQVSADMIGPTPVNMQSSGYRGKGGAGEDFILFNTIPSRLDNVFLDDKEIDPRSHRPTAGWHYLRMTSSEAVEFTVANTNTYAVRGFGYRKGGPSPYGGFRLAEMVVCSNFLSQAQREYVNFYLKRKWFGGYPVKKVVLAEGTTLDSSEAPVSVTYFQMTGEASVNGLDKINMVVPSGESTNILVASGVYRAMDRNVSAIPNLEFQKDGKIVIDAGTNAANIVKGSGAFIKSGNGALSVGFLGEGFTSLEVDSGVLTINPLLAPSAFHVDAADSAAFELSYENGTNFISRWDDVLRNGQGLSQTSHKYAYGAKTVINRPFLAENCQNGLPMVDFGTQSDAEHQEGWGGMLDIVKPIAKSESDIKETTDEMSVLQLFSVWEDDPASFERAYIEDEKGVLKPTIGPSLFGGGYSWYRGAGGNGEGFPFCSMSGPASVREEMWLDNVRFYSQYVRFTPIGRGVHLMDQRIKPTSGGSDMATVGGNRDASTTNGPYSAKGVYGGVRIGEVMAFRYALPMNQRTQIRNALGVKWFGSEMYSHDYGFDDIDIAHGASLSLPYANVTIRNFEIAGSFSSRSLSVLEVLSIVGDSDVDSLLSLKSGGTLSVSRKEDGSFAEVKVSSFAIEQKGVIEISEWDGVECDKEIRLVKSDVINGDASKWVGRNPDGTIKARFKVGADGLYLTFESTGLRIVVR